MFSVSVVLFSCRPLAWSGEPHQEFVARGEDEPGQQKSQTLSQE